MAAPSQAFIGVNAERLKSEEGYGGKSLDGGPNVARSRANAEPSV